MKLLVSEDEVQVVAENTWEKTQLRGIAVRPKQVLVTGTAAGDTPKFRVLLGDREAPAASDDTVLTLRQQLDAATKAALLSVMRLPGTTDEAAARLGISRKHYWDLRRKFGLID